MSLLAHIDPEINSVIQKELTRERDEINLIASENYVPEAVLQATGSILTNKYAEGYPGKRYYAGCEYIDQAEQLAIERCKKLFGAEHVNVQPHAGSQANMAAYFAVLEPGDTIMGMSLAEGGHLTHGHHVNFSGKIFKSVQYTLNKETELLDYNAIEKLALIHKPKLIIAGASAYSRIIDFAKFAEIAQKVNAYFLADIAHIAGLIATGLHPSPVELADVITSTTHKTLRGPRGGLIMSKTEHAQSIDKSIMPGLQGGPLMHVIAAKAVAFHLALQPDFYTYQKNVIQNAQIMATTLQELGYRIVSGGTDNHMFVVDVRSKGINGKIAAHALEQAGIIVSRSCIPFDPEKPWITSGIRIGTPAITTRGMTTDQANEIAQIIDECLVHHQSEKKLHAIKQKMKALCAEFPLYPKK